MRRRDFAKLLDGTSDAAYAVNHEGVIVAWNDAARKLFGLTPAQAVGQYCREVVRGFDECGLVCSHDCHVQQSVNRRVPLENFDLRIRTVRGEQWCNMSVVITDCQSSTFPYSIHIVRPDDLRKRLELMIRDFVVSKTNATADEAMAIVSSHRMPNESDLTNREVEILRLLAVGGTTRRVADDLHLSPNTVNNHIQHILHKLGAHTRLEAIRRAERSGAI